MTDPHQCPLCKTPYENGEDWCLYCSETNGEEDYP